MQQQPPPSLPSQPAARSPLLTAILIIAGACVLLAFICMCVIAVIAIMGPQIGNIFSRITNGLSSP